MKFYKITNPTNQKLTGIKCDKCNQLYESTNESTVKEIYSFNLQQEITNQATCNIDCDICEYCLSNMLGKFGRVTYDYH